MNKAVQIGFEFEFRHNLNYKEIRRQIQKMFPLDVMAKTSNNPEGDPTEFQVKNESGLYLENDQEQLKTACEISTPAWPYRQAIRNFKKILEWMQYNGVETSSKCGIHVNMSFINEKTNLLINPLKILFFTRDREIIREFGRCDNGNCGPVDLFIEEVMTECKKKSLKETYNHFFEECLDYLCLKDYSLRFPDSSFGGNYEPQENLYVEFRALGGRNYQYHSKQLIEHINHFVKVLRMSIDPETDTKLKNRVQYLKGKVKSCEKLKL